MSLGIFSSPACFGLFSYAMMTFELFSGVPLSALVRLPELSTLHPHKFLHNQLNKETVFS